MGRKSSEKKRRRAGKTSSISKGRIVEKIVAAMHGFHGVKVERNVRVPTLRDPNRKREIDVLITSNPAGYPIQIAVECKNEKGSIGAPQIDAFVGKLADIGIPPQHGVYVSASGYTSDAIARAVEARIRPLILTGLTKERLAASIAEAFQSIVYLLLQIVNIRVRNRVPQVQDSYELLVFYNERGQIRGSAPDFIWQQWINGQLPSSIGEHDLELSIPAGWHQVVNGKAVPLISVTAKIRVVGLIVTLGGRANQHLLVNVFNKQVEKSYIDVTFDTSRTWYPVTIIRTESEFEKLTSRSETVKLTIGRIRLPRIQLGPMYWPPSERTARTVMGLMRAFEAGEIPDPRPFDIAQLEGTDMQVIWEPIWQGNQGTQETQDGS